MMKRSFTGSTDRGRSFWIIPAFFLAAWYALVRARGPFWLGTNSDPEYAYLCNSLNFLEGRPILHLDHPGTPLHVLGAWVIRAVQALLEGSFQTETVLRSPEMYLTQINHVLVGAFLSVFCFSSWRISKVWQGSGLTWALPGTVMLSSVFFTVSTRVFPELLLLSIGPVVVWLVFDRLAADRPFSCKQILLLSCLSGLGIADKVTFFPLVIFVAMLLESVRKRAWYLLLCLAWVVVFTWPIRENYGRWLGFVWQLTIHTGIYGEGAPVVVDPWILAANFIRLHQSEPVFFALFYAGLWLLKSRKCAVFSRGPLSQRTLQAILVTQALGILLVCKHSLIGKEYYLLAVMFLSGWLLGILLEIGLPKKRMVAVFAIILLWRAVDLAVIRDRLEQTARQQLEIVRKAETDYRDYAKVYYYRASSPAAALRFGGFFSGMAIGDKLKQVYGQIYYYDIWYGIYSTWNQILTLEEIERLSGGRVLFQGSSFDTVHKDYPQYRPDLALEDIAGGDPETLYLLST